MLMCLNYENGVHKLQQDKTWCSYLGIVDGEQNQKDTSNKKFYVASFQRSGTHDGQCRIPH